MDASTNDDVPRVARWMVPWIVNAHQMADAAVRLIGRLGLSPKDDKIPEAFYFEIAAIARLGEWEQAGIKDLIDPTLPSFAEAMADLSTRLITAGNSKSKLSPDLSKRVLNAWASRCAHESRLELGVDIVLDMPDVEILIEELASILWKHRHLSLPKEGQV